MASKNPGLKAAAPKNVFLKPLKFEFKDLFKALAKGVGHTAAGKWEELASQLEIARARSHERSDWSATIQRCLDIWVPSDEFYVDRRFLDRPADLPLVRDTENLLRFWLEGNRVPHRAQSPSPNVSPRISYTR